MSGSLIILIAVFLFFILAGLPIAWAMLTAAVAWIIFTGNYHYLQILPQRLFEGIDVFVLLAIPLFVLTGEIINAGKVTDKLINMADVYFGWIRGGLAQVNIGTSILFSGITGTAVGDVAALGRVFIPAMTKQGFPAAYAAAVTAASSIIGPMVPPSLVIIVYGAATGMSHRRHVCRLCRARHTDRGPADAAGRGAAAGGFPAESYRSFLSGHCARDPYSRRSAHDPPHHCHLYHQRYRHTHRSRRHSGRLYLAHHPVPVQDAQDEKPAGHLFTVNGIFVTTDDINRMRLDTFLDYGCRTRA